MTIAEVQEIGIGDCQCAFGEFHRLSRFNSLDIIARQMVIWFHLVCWTPHEARGMRSLATQLNPPEMDLPEDKGTYILIAQVSHMKRLEIGSLGKFDIVPGFYAYVGSAFGSGGLGARIGHHLESTAEPHWHIDYLLQVATPLEVWFTTTNRKLENHWAERLEDAPGFRVPIPRFGSSDYHRSRSSHLFYSKRRPLFRWFQQQIMEKFEGVEVERCLIQLP